MDKICNNLQEYEWIAIKRGKSKMKLRRLGCGLLAVVLSLPAVFPVTSYASNFWDVTGHWAEFYISKVYNEHIISGYPNGYFLPDKAVTRAEFASMVNETFELDDIDRDESINFSDVSYSSWYYKDVSIAIATGYAGGYNDNTFKPNNPITRQEAAVMLSRLIPEGKKNGNLKSFSDSKKIESWATDAMAKMNGKGYIGAYSDKKLHPADPLTRAQTAKILSEILDNEDIITRRTVVDEDETKLTAKTFVGDVLIDEDLEEGSATIDNCIILGDLIIEGGGDGTITLNNTRVANAIVNKEDGAVRVVSKGNTIVSKLEASESCSLQTSSKAGYGFPDITIKGSSDVKLKGTFPNISIKGSRAGVTLESGEITKLTVVSAGRYSDITLSGKSKIAEAAVNAECYFHGQGTIIYMIVNADDVTYETKPDKMTVGLQSDRPEQEGDENVSVTFKPKSKDEDVDVDTKITITFNTSMKMADGGEISDSDISNFITLHSGSKSGPEVEFTAAINSAKKIITLTPSAKLSEGTKYYVVLADEALKNTGGNKNNGKSIYFTTEGDAPGTTSPAVTAPSLSNLSLTPTDTSITASFTPNSAGTVYAMISESSAVPATQTIAASKSAAATANTAGTLTFTGLTANKRYYVFAFLRNSSGTDSSVVSANTMTTISDATLSDLTVAATSGGINLLTGFSPTTKTYSIPVPFGTTAVDVTASTNTTTNVNAVITINDTAAASRTIPVTAGSTTTIRVRIAADNKTPAEYVINVTVPES